MPENTVLKEKIKTKRRRENYKRIGDYIQRVEVRNTDLKVTNLLGLSMAKEFRPTTSNIVGTDLSVYRVMKKFQFACDFMSPIRVNKLPVVLKLDDDPNLVSPAYPVFEIIDRSLLLPEYLMMWFRRPEFDRYATFKCDAAIRGGYGWEELCDTLIPVPPIEKQREIVEEYKVVEDRIELNNQMIQKLEETAQAIYKHWFVDFEFPDENGKPYKSSGGEMVESELGEIPKGWEIKSFTEVAKLGGGGTPDTKNPTFWNGGIPFFTPVDANKSYYSIQTEKSISSIGFKNSSTKIYRKNTVFVTARGTVGSISVAGCEMAMNQSCYALTGKFQFFIHQLTIEAMDKLKTEAVGAVFGALVTKDFESHLVTFPSIGVQEKFDKGVSSLYNYLLLKTRENKRLTDLKVLLLSKLSTLQK